MSDEEENHPITIPQPRLLAAVAATSGARSLCKSAKSRRQLDPAVVHLLATPPKGQQGHPCTPRGQGTAQQVTQSNYTGGSEERPF